MNDLFQFTTQIRWTRWDEMKPLLGPLIVSDGKEIDLGEMTNTGFYSDNHAVCEGCADPIELVYWAQLPLQSNKRSRVYNKEILKDERRYTYSQLIDIKEALYEAYQLTSAASEDDSKERLFGFLNDIRELGEDFF